MYLPADMTSSASHSSRPLANPVQYVKGIGPRKAAVLEKYGITNLYDLFFYVPRRYLDRTAVVSIAELRQLTRRLPSTNEEELPHADVRRDLTVVGDVRSFSVVGARSKARFVLVLGDSSGSMQCVWFGGIQYWKNRFRIGETIAVSGEPSYFGGILQFIHPDLDRISPHDDSDEPKPEHEVDWSKALNTGGLVPLYPSGKELESVGLDSGGFRRVVSTAIHQHLDLVTETLPKSVMERHRLVSLKPAIRTVHFPSQRTDIDESLRRLKYEELFYFQLKLALKRHWVKENTDGITFNVQSKLARRLVDSLPFELTKAQVRVINEITNDMRTPRPLNRLLQGDVGSGKTVVALVAMLIAVDNGYQAVLMAPTEILAEQHYRTITALLRGIPLNVRLLIGGQRTRLRRDLLDDVQRGSAQIVVGTHALFEKKVDFANLGIVIIDEQHRFGVMQRASIRQKGSNPDVLVMTATPIPRTLSLTLYGDLDVSTIDELPKNRRPVKTILSYDEEKTSVFEFVRDQVRQGRQAYFVYPLIEESDKLDLKAATVHFEDLQQNVFRGLRLGLLHGRMSTEEKDMLMSRFKARELDILVATTVIEVGIDVPNASTIVIENAERFGLSQLHQLRGRVGRGIEQSYCILLAKKWIAKKAERLQSSGQRMGQVLEEQHQAERRLATMVSTTDGFKIAEVDLQLRGPGDFFGTRQSGIPEFKVANILTDTKLLEQSRADAFAIIERDPQLHLPEHQMIAQHLRAHFAETLPLIRVG